jgi:hypothetical protein
MSEHRAITPLFTAAAVVLAATALAGCSQTTTTAVTTPASSTTQANPRADSSAKTVAQTAQTAVETYATEQTNGSYSGVSPETLQRIEPSLQIIPDGRDAYLSGATSRESGKGYVVTATATTGDTFTVTRNINGDIMHTCTPAGNEGCPEGGTSW